MRAPRFTIREILLVTAVIALGIPYIYNPVQRAVLPQYEFRVSQTEILSWVQTVDPTAKSHSDARGGNGFANDAQITIEFDPPGYANIKAIEQGIISKLKKEGWTLNGHGGGAGINLKFYFHKGPSRYRLYVIENASNDFRPAIDRRAQTYRIIAIHDSNPKF